MGSSQSNNRGENGGEHKEVQPTKTPPPTMRKKKKQVSISSDPPPPFTGIMAELLAGVQLEKADKSKVAAETALQNKVVGLYFSAHWCPPCRQFTPLLKDFYGELEDSGEFEIVFVSFDRSENDLKKYMAECHGDWYHLPFGNEKIQELSTKYSVSGIPALIIIKADGTEITKNGRNDVQGKPPAQALAAWKKA